MNFANIFQINLLFSVFFVILQSDMIFDIISIKLATKFVSK